MDALRAAGCVFAEDEAAVLRGEARTRGHLGPCSPAGSAESRWSRSSAGRSSAACVWPWRPGCSSHAAAARCSSTWRSRTCRAHQGRVVVDLCCGTGAVGLAVADRVDAVDLHASDLDPVCGPGARRNLGEERVHEGDLYDALPASLAGQVDVLVANAPYVPTDEIFLMPAEARDHEHRVALDGGSDGLDLHRRIAAGAPDWLRPGGILLIETSRRQAEGSLSQRVPQRVSTPRSSYGRRRRSPPQYVRFRDAGISPSFVGSESRSSTSPPFPALGSPGRKGVNFRADGSVWQNDALSRTTPGPSHPDGGRPPDAARPTHSAGALPTTNTSQGDTTHVAVKIRLKRMGKIRQPYYRVVVVDARKKRDGKVIEEIGKYHPKEEPSYIEVVSDRAQYWLGVGAQPSEAVAALLKVTGDWQKFKGLPGAEGTLRTREPRRDKTEIFNEALKDAANEPRGEAVTRKRAPRRPPSLLREPPPRPPSLRPRPCRRGRPRRRPRRGNCRPETGADESAVTTEAAAEADEKTEA